MVFDLLVYICNLCIICTWYEGAAHLDDITCLMNNKSVVVQYPDVSRLSVSITLQNY